MKIGLVLSQPFGQSLGTDYRIRGVVKGLCELGVEVHVITPYMDNFSMTQKNAFVHSPRSLSAGLRFSNLTYIVSKRFLNNSFLFKNVCRKSLLLKIIRSLGANVYKIARKLDLDVIQAIQQVASMACVDIRKKLGVPVVAEFHGILVEEMVASGVIKHNDNCYKVLFDLEQEIACSADAVTVVGEEIKSYIEKSFGVSRAKVVVIPNATFLRVENAKIAEHPEKVIHSGTLHPWENAELFVQAMPLVLKRYPSARFYLTRWGAKLNRIKKLASDLGVSPEFIWFPSSEGFFDFLKSCDIGVISAATNIVRRMNYPAKLYDYLSVGLPIVANEIESGWTRIIKDNRVGVVTDNNPEALAGGILKLLENPNLIYECGQRGIELVKRELNWYKSAEKLLDLYKRLA